MCELTFLFLCHYTAFFFFRNSFLFLFKHATRVHLFSSCLPTMLLSPYLCYSLLPVCFSPTPSVMRSLLCVPPCFYPLPSPNPFCHLFAFLCCPPCCRLLSLLPHCSSSHSLIVASTHPLPVLLPYSVLIQPTLTPLLLLQPLPILLMFCFPSAFTLLFLSYLQVKLDRQTKRRKSCHVIL